MKKKVVILLVLGIVLVGFLFVYFQKRSGHRLAPALAYSALMQELSNATPRAPKATASFHPDTVSDFTWKVSGKNFTFHRDNVRKPWLPDVNPWQIQERLLMLAFVDREKIAATDRPIVEIQLTFTDGKQWIGAWDGHFFRWEDGSRLGRGAILTREEFLFFIEGQFAFEKHQLAICKERLESLSFVNFEKALTFRSLEQGWVMNDSPASNAFSNAIEEWLGAYCTVEIDHFLDPEVVDLDSPNSGLELGMASGKKNRIGYHEQYFKLDGLWFESQVLRLGIAKLWNFQKVN
ncbi:MAG: hypothetical protein SGJ18_11575 [Pseudomonadota bacterium]|nr:hypothetical protein [Pseudomonadota bacterium]